MADLGSTPNLSTLSGFGDSRVIPGDEIYVVAEDADFVYRLPPPSFVADGVNSVKAIFLVGTWIRRSSGTGASLAQAAWFIDPANGSDTNVGDTLAAALKTDAERQRRWGPSTILTQNTTVTYASSPPATDVVNYDVLINGQFTLTISGTSTVDKTGTITAANDVNPGAQTYSDVTAVNLGVAGDVGKFLEITGGARVGAYGRLLTQTGLGNAMRISKTGTLSYPASSSTFFPLTTPVNGDPFQTLILTVLNVGYWNFVGGSNTSQSGSRTPNVLIDSLALTGGTIAAAEMRCDAIQVYTKKCTLTAMVLAGDGTWSLAGAGIDGCRFQTWSSISAGLACSLTDGTTQILARFIFDSQTIVQASQLQLQGYLRNGAMAFFDAAAGSTLLLLPGANVRGLAFTTTDLIWGTNNTGVAVSVQSGSQLIYNGNKPTVNTPLGAGRQSAIGGTNTDWAGVPFINPGNNAMIVALA